MFSPPMPTRLQGDHDFDTPIGVIILAKSPLGQATAFAHARTRYDSSKGSRGLAANDAMKEQLQLQLVQ